MCSKPLCNLFRIFFLAAVAFIHSDRAFYDPLRAQSATVPQNSPFLLHFSVFAQFFVSHAPVCGGAWRLGGRPVGRDGRFAAHGSRFFAAQWVTPRPCKRFAVFAAAGVCGGLHARQRDAVPPLHRGAGLLHICHSLFCPPCPAPDSRFPIADFYLRQLPAFNLSCVNCNPSRAILCGTYLIIKGMLPCVNLQLVYLKQL